MKADKIHQEALQKAQEITQDAQRRAYKIVEDAEALSNNRREGANQYARETLFELEERLSTVLGQVRRGIDTPRLGGRDDGAFLRARITVR